MMNPDRRRHSLRRPVNWCRAASFAALFVLAGWGPLSAPAAAADDRYKVANGIAAYLGVMPAAILRGHAPTHPESSMHGGAPTGVHAYHLVVALFDGSRGARISDASVNVAIGGLGHVAETRVDLEPMTIADTVTYGAFVNLANRGRYVIAVDVRRPGREKPTRFEFVYEHGRP